MKVPKAPANLQRRTATAIRSKAAIIPKASSRAGTKPEPVEPPSALISEISSAKKFSDLPPYLGNSKLIKQFRATCFHGWMASGDPFDGFALESEYFLEVICDAFKETFPDVQYVPRHKDVFHQTVSVIITLFAIYQLLLNLNRSMITSKRTGPTLPVTQLRKSRPTFPNCRRTRLRNGQLRFVRVVWVS